MANEKRDSGEIIVMIFLVLWIFVSSYILMTLSDDAKEQKIKNEQLEKRCDSLESKIHSLYVEKISVELFQELINSNIKFSDIVLKQAFLETGTFTSYSFSNRHNLFGFQGQNGYLEFKDWKECVKYCKEWQDKYYKGGDYYDFLEKLPYAQDSTYVSVLRDYKIKF